MTDVAACRVPLSAYPGMNPFVLRWLSGSIEATRFLPRIPWGDVDDRTRRERRIPADLAKALIESNRRWGSFVREDVERWASGEAVAIVAGQQVGFAGGPLYTLAKLATMIRMKRDLNARGVAATIFFWLATEDHDYDEAATLQLPVWSVASGRSVNRQIDLITLKASRPVASKQVVGSSIIPEPLVAQLLALYDMPRPSWLREGISFADSFAELLTTVAGERVVFVDALLPELRRAGAPLFKRMLGNMEAMQNAVRSRSQQLADAGFTPQIVPRENGDYTLLFRLDEHGERHIIDNPAEIDDPTTISTSAVTRPLLQDAVIQPDIFVGGPSEVAYYAQIAPLHDLLGVNMPQVSLRGHAVVAAKRIVKLLSRFEIDPAEVFGKPDEILAAREPKGVAEIESIAEAARRDLSARIAEIGEIALPADHALARAITRSIGHIEYHFDKLAERAVRGLVRKDRERYAAIRELVSTFHPDGHVQDRVVAWFAYWNQFGSHLVDCLVENITPDADVFSIVPL